MPPPLLAQSFPAVEPLLKATPTAVLGAIAFVLAVALALSLKVALTRKCVDHEELERLWDEIDTLRKRSHKQASLITALMLRAKLPPPDEDE